MEAHMRGRHVTIIASLFLLLGLPVTAHQPKSDERDQRGLDFYSFDALPGATTNPQGINSRGDIVGSYALAGKTHGFLWSDGVLTTIDYPGAVFTDARGINARGDIVGAYKLLNEPAVNIHAYLLDKHGRYTPIDFPDHQHTNTIAQRITASGLIVGCRHDTDMMATMRGIMVNAGDLNAFGEIDAFGSMNNGASPDGQLIVGLYTDMDTNRGRGYLLYGQTFTPFDVPGSTFTAAWDVNASGEVVGVYRDARDVAHGFLWSDLQFATINYPGAVTTRAFGINSRGTIVGSYTDTANKVHGFAAVRRPRKD
jgi:probable HAF family extracellular repeat protein